MSRPRSKRKRGVGLIRYPLRGVRGRGGVTRARASARGPTYVKRARRSSACWCRSSRASGSDKLEAIARTDGVDGRLHRPADLAAGPWAISGQQGHPEVQKAIEDAVKRIKACGKPAGILAVDETAARRYMEWGTTLHGRGLDAMDACAWKPRSCARNSNSSDRRRP
jgi:4-hydroxy-2-oxoheptanedioate aldolase